MGAKTNSLTAVALFGVIAALVIISDSCCQGANAYSCAVRITVPHPDGSSPDRIGTGAIVKDNGDYYLVTAYHVIHGSEHARISAQGRFGLNLDRDFDSLFYINTAADLAVFKMLPDSESSITGILSPATLLDVKNTTISDSATGNLAIAVGNPSRKGARSVNIAYSCTLSEYVSAGWRIGGAIRPKGEIGQESRKAAINQKFLFLETLSISKGFSGGPILIGQPSATSPVATKAVLVGIVLGGDIGSTVKAGRYAWAATAGDVRRGINVIQHVGAPPHPSYEKLLQYSRAEWTPVCYQEHRSLSFGTAYVFDDTEFDQKTYVDRCGFITGCDHCNETRERYRGPIFDRCNFRNIMFDRQDLSDSQFVECEFHHVSFEGADLTGAVFDECVFKVKELPIQPVLHNLGQPALAYGAIVRNATIVASGSTTSSHRRELSEVQETREVGYGLSMTLEREAVRPKPTLIWAHARFPLFFDTLQKDDR